ncbi:glycoside hydrolase family 3 N-terminal domain-containing protein [Alicyclobacillus fastidiosus]|uniref:beta-glucosidase n=1 Tax=Alicyclobacillus fastidiosus TaxID=392011 RepID=A0ABV5AB95_9BACL|nr:glycoside hydrolase family 3 N-terminal domain-containing protein [Alicyclobacillus fastidiosus]WEH10558.1 glycoside hydrolase family 3 N-terminal domain-containing protein [Alicyclobacillus fastidiosus]
MENQKIIELLENMTIEEKIGQLSQITGEHYVGKMDDEMVETGPVIAADLMTGEFLYMVGSIIGVSSAKATNMVQSTYLEKSRLKIPLLFMHDAIHGYKTIFPIPLALSCTWDQRILEKVAEHTASELRAAGIHVNFSPMVDLVRDSRWGRVMESFGEDHILSGDLGAAMIRGYQKNDNGKIADDGVAACLKHFAAYGAAVGGKDYNSVDMSMREFHDYYGKPYEIALKRKPKFVMSSFNTFNGVPVTASEEMMKSVLRGMYHFDGLVISDWGAISELQNHRVAKDRKEAAELALNAGIDVEMCSTTYFENYKGILEQTPQLMREIDAAVLKILNLKNELGLFENPYVDEDAEASVILNTEFQAFSKEVVKRSCVLLKNEGMLPIDKNSKNILIIGPFSKTNELLGNWSCKGQFTDVISLKSGITALDSTLEVSAYEKFEDCPPEKLLQCDYMIVAIGECWNLSGEGHSSVNLVLEEEQRMLLRQVKETNKPYSVVCFAGRPLAMQNVIDDIPALLWCWYPGTQAGSAIAELLMGKDTPSGKLTMSFPRHSAQVPIYYNELSSGRPANETSYSSRYQDSEIGPLFKFGHGLTYTNARYSGLRISGERISENQDVKISFEIENPSDYDYSEIVVLYVQDVVSKIARPTHEMKKYQVVPILARQTVTVEFVLTLDDLKYLDNNLQLCVEPGDFKLFINDLNHPVCSIQY